MKKLFAIFLVVFTLGACSSSDDGNNSSNSQITPPSWIQGTWAEETIYYDTGSIFGFKFTSNDICSITPTFENCFGKLSQGQIRFEQSITDTEYKLVMKTDFQSTIIAHVRKINATKIADISIIDNDFSPTYVKIN